MKKLILLLLLMLLVSCSSVAEPAVDACMVGIDLAIQQTMDACITEYGEVIDSLSESANTCIENANQLFLVADFWKARTDYLEVRLNFTEADRRYLGCLGTWVGDDDPRCKASKYPADKLSALKEIMDQAGEALTEYVESE